MLLIYCKKKLYCENFISEKSDISQIIFLKHTRKKNPHETQNAQLLEWITQFLLISELH